MNNESLVDTVIGVGEAAIKNPSETRVHEEQSISGPVAKRHSRMVKHVREKEQGHSQPKGKGKGKGKGKRKDSGKGNHNQDQTGSPNEDGQRTLGDFGFETSKS